MMKIAQKSKRWLGQKIQDPVLPNRATGRCQWQSLQEGGRQSELQPEVLQQNAQDCAECQEVQIEPSFDFPNNLLGKEEIPRRSFSVLL